MRGGKRLNFGDAVLIFGVRAFAAAFSGKMTRQDGVNFRRQSICRPTRVE
jgi:hypothetical protein